MTVALDLKDLTRSPLFTARPRARNPWLIPDKGDTVAADQSVPFHKVPRPSFACVHTPVMTKWLKLMNEFRNSVFLQQEWVSKKKVGVDRDHNGMSNPFWPLEPAGTRRETKSISFKRANSQKRVFLGTSKRCVTSCCFFIGSVSLLHPFTGTGMINIILSDEISFIFVRELWRQKEVFLRRGLLFFSVWRMRFPE